MSLKRSISQVSECFESAPKRLCTEDPIDLEAIPEQPAEFEPIDLEEIPPAIFSSPSYTSQDSLWSFDPIDLEVTRKEMEEQEEDRAGAELLCFLNHPEFNKPFHWMVCSQVCKQF